MCIYLFRELVKIYNNNNNYYNYNYKKKNNNNSNNYDGNLCMLGLNGNIEFLFFASIDTQTLSCQ